MDTQSFVQLPLLRWLRQRLRNPEGETCRGKKVPRCWRPPSKAYVVQPNQRRRSALSRRSEDHEGPLFPRMLPSESATAVLLNLLKPLSCLTRSKESTKAITSCKVIPQTRNRACKSVPVPLQLLYARRGRRRAFSGLLTTLWMRLRSLRRLPKKGDDHVTLLKLDAKMSRCERTVAQEAARRPERLGDQGG